VSQSRREQLENGVSEDDAEEKRQSISLPIMEASGKRVD
jgi:hypothetical protein